VTSNNQFSRRQFLSAVAASGVVVGLPKAPVLGANEKLRIGIIGCGGQGDSYPEWIRQSGGELVAVSDADERRMAETAKKGRGTVKQYQDFRGLLADDRVDAVMTATPNHWHSLVTVMACEAGKDVYVEKPVSHNIWEGRQMVAAADKYDRIVQAGTQQRSDPALITTRELIAAREFGPVQWIHALWYANRGSIGNVTQPQPVPPHIDYNLWIGPRPLVPLRRKTFHYDWHWFWTYGNSDMGNRVIHNIDDIHHIMQMGDSQPERMMEVGGRFKYDDDATTPNTALMVMDWDVPLIFGSRNLNLIHRGKSTDAASVYRRFGRANRFVNIIKCEKGIIEVRRGGGNVYDHDGKKLRSISGDGGAGHLKNFIEAVKARDRGLLNAPIHESHRSSSMMHTGNISYRIGRLAGVDEARDAVSGFSEAEEAWRQMVEHLKRHEIDLETEKPTLGPWLTFDPEKERFTGDHADIANTLVRDTYRRPFVMPELV